jgi:transposase
MSKRDELYSRKQEAMKLLDMGYSRQEANEQSGLNYSKAGILHLYREWKKRGEEALADKRQGGQPYKVTREVREWLVERCQEDGEVHSPQLVAEIEAEFEVVLHHDYVNLLRHQLGLPAPKAGRPRQKESKEPAGEQTAQQDFSP